MSIAFYREQGKTLLATAGKSGLLIYLSLGLGALGLFGLGRLYGLGETTCALSLTNEIPQVENIELSPSPKMTPIPPKGQGARSEVTASRNGTKYYFPWCAGISRIKDENKITFANESEAQSAGYTKAANCE